MVQVGFLSSDFMSIPKGMPIDPGKIPLLWFAPRDFHSARTPQALLFFFCQYSIYAADEPLCQCLGIGPVPFSGILFPEKLIY